MSAKVTIIGNLGRDPETRINANNTFIANFSIAVNHQRKTAAGEVKKTDWYNITATGKQAQVLAEYARKGDPLLVEGKQTFNPWTDREGNSRVSVDVLVQDFRFLGGGSRNDEGGAAAPEAAESMLPTTFAKHWLRGEFRLFRRKLSGGNVKGISPFPLFLHISSPGHRGDSRKAF